MSKPAPKSGKRHYLKQYAEIGENITACGLVGWAERGTADEYSTAVGNRFAATIEKSRVTCARCKAFAGVSR